MVQSHDKMAARTHNGSMYGPLGMELLEVNRPRHKTTPEFDSSSAMSYTSNLADQLRVEEAEQPLIQREGSPLRESQKDGTTSDCPMIIRASHKKRYRFKSWKIGVAAAALMSTAVFLTNCAFTIWASVKFRLENGVGTVYEGDCDVVSAWSFWLHIFIN